MNSNQSARVVSRMRQAQRDAWAAEARGFLLAADFADLHAVVDETCVVLPGQERLVRMGADGTPEVAEFCILELAAALRPSLPMPLGVWSGMR